MTDEEWLQILEKKVSSFEVLHFPRIWSGEREDAHLLQYCEMFIIGRNLTIFPVWL